MKDMSAANKIKKIVDDWIDKNFNYVHIEVVEKMANDGMLFEHIRQEEITEDQLMEYDLMAEYENSEYETPTEFLSEEHDDISCEIRDGNYPMYNTLFEFRDSHVSEEWIGKAIDAGFGVIEDVNGFSTLLFVAGAGYSFLSAHWIPFYLSIFRDHYEGLKEFDNVDYSMV